MTDKPDRWIEIANVGRPHGLRGDVRVFPHNPATELLLPGAKLQYRKAGNQTERTISKARLANDCWIVVFDGVTDRAQAEALTGGELLLRRSELPAIDDDEVYLSDVVGMAVFDAETGMPLGEVQRVGETNVQLLDIALDAGGTVLVPLVDAYVVAIDQQGVHVRDIDHWRQE